VARRRVPGLKPTPLLLLLVVACGRPSTGGDGTHEVVCDALGACVPVADEDAPPTASDPEDDWPADWIAREDEMLALVNELRAAGAECPTRTFSPAPPLSSNEALRRAARLHSMDMATEGYFSHTSLDGRDPFQRMADEGYDGQPGGENIAAGSDTAEGTFSQWVTSSGHCANMASASFTEIGIGTAFVEGSPFGHYWTQTFGSR
jgi:uncharacterized protein YkwD